jgi:alcohol dehydrogenase (cytochrome c)
VGGTHLAILVGRSGARSVTGRRQRRALHPRRAALTASTRRVIAIRPKTGEIALLSSTRKDVYDVDGNDEQVLADLRVNGQPRKVMIQANKNGFMYVLDRTNCTLIAAHPFVKVNWASTIDPATGRPVLTDVYKRFLAGDEVEIWPSRGTNAVPMLQLNTA